MAFKGRTNDFSYVCLVCKTPGKGNPNQKCCGAEIVNGRRIRSNCQKRYEQWRKKHSSSGYRGEYLKRKRVDVLLDLALAMRDLESDPHSDVFKDKLLRAYDRFELFALQHPDLVHRSKMFYGRD